MQLHKGGLFFPIVLALAWILLCAALLTDMAGFAAATRRLTRPAARTVQLHPARLASRP